jgi:hypothetical protein
MHDERENSVVTASSTEHPPSTREDLETGNLETGTIFAACLFA